MKKYLLIAFLFAFVSFKSNAQNILVVNDNDNITLNTDTLLAALDLTMYNSYDYWSVPDSSGITPSFSLLNTYDLVIWYASTDGVDLSMWGGSNAGDTNLVDYIQTGKPVWIIGQDILYDQYPSYGAFNPGEFAFDYMGLDSYDAQSYVDDGNLGVAVLSKTISAPSTFPSSIEWTFSTLWYVDGCTANIGTLELYMMGPLTYILSGKACMFHNKTSSLSVMSTFFDPALINTQANRVSFLQEGIKYLLSTNVGVESIDKSDVKIWPNPARNQIMIQSNHSNLSKISIMNLSGCVLQQTDIDNKSVANIELKNIPTGMYLMNIEFENGAHHSTMMQVNASN